MKTNQATARYLTLIALAATCLPAGPEQRPRNDEPVPVVLARVPDKARAKRNPFANDFDAPLAGKKLFEQRCAECHGSHAEGASRGPSLRANEMQQATPGELFWILTNGVVRRGMPAWSKLPAEQRWQIITWLKSGP